MPDVNGNLSLRGARKRELVESVIKRLKPNTYQDEHSSWSTLEKGLMKMSNQELGWLEILIQMKHNI